MDVETNDIELVRRIASGGDREAEAELLGRIASRIRLYGLRHLRNEHAAEDLTQQVLIVTLEALRAGRPEGTGKACVLRTGHVPDDGAQLAP